MRERTEHLIRQIQKLEQRRNDEADEDIRELIDDKIKALQKELFDLQENLQPQRFEQVISLIIEECREMIDSNDIFVDGDKDIFLSRFVKPYLKFDDLKTIQKSPFSKSNSLRTYKEILEQTNGQVEIFHYFPITKLKTTATFDPYSKKVMYNGEPNMSPSAAAIKATKEITGKKSSLNGWIFWKYIDASGNEKTIDNLKQ